MRLSTAVQEFLDTYRDAKRSPRTVAGYAKDLRGLIALAHVEASDQVPAFTEALVAAYFAAARRKGLHTNTLLRHRAAFNQFAAWGLRRRLWTENPMLNAPEYKRPKRLPRPFSIAERAALLALALPPAEELLRAILYHTGLRESAICGLRLGDLALGDGGRPGTLRAVSKGDKEQVIPIIPELDAILRGHLKALADRDSGRPLLARPSGAPWTGAMVRRRVRLWGEAAGVPHCLPHRWRHTYGTRLFERKADPRAAQRLMGHQSITTTMLYTEVVDREVEAAALLLSDAPVDRTDYPPRPRDAAQGPAVAALKVKRACSDAPESPSNVIALRPRNCPPARGSDNRRARDPLIRAAALTKLAAQRWADQQRSRP